MAAAGLNVVLVSRTPAKLKKVADEISNCIKFKCLIRCLNFYLIL